jgi:hypothetical protein
MKLSGHYRQLQGEQGGKPMNPDVLASLIVNAPLLPQGFITIKKPVRIFHLLPYYAQLQC